MTLEKQIEALKHIHSQMALYEKAIAKLAEERQAIFDEWEKSIKQLKP